jgi:hypothetical protein
VSTLGLWNTKGRRRTPFGTPRSVLQGGLIPQQPLRIFGPVSNSPEDPHTCAGSLWISFFNASLLRCFGCRKSAAFAGIVRSGRPALGAEEARHFLANLVGSALLVSRTFTTQAAILVPLDVCLPTAEQSGCSGERTGGHRRSTLAGEPVAGERRFPVPWARLPPGSPKNRLAEW